MGISNNINSVVLHMLLIQYLQFVVFPRGVAVCFSCFWAFLYSSRIYIAAYSAYLFFSKFFWYNIQSQSGITKLF